MQHPMLTIARRAAEEAGRLIERGYRDLSRIKVQEKGRGDFVSVIDQQSEQIIRQILQDKFPEHDILGEEFGGLSVAESDYQWIIDPLDGTANFVHGLPHFAISIALLKKGQLEIGLIYNPITDEMFSAARGEGAFCNGQRIRANGQRDSHKAMIATGFPFKTPEQMTQQFAYCQSVLEDFSDLRRLGAAALDLCYVACGRQDGYFESGIKPWDIAAGILIAQEAGCLVSDYGDEKAMLDTETIVCANAYLHPILMKALRRARLQEVAE